MHRGERLGSEQKEDLSQPAKKSQGTKQNKTDNNNDDNRPTKKPHNLRSLKGLYSTYHTEKNL